MLREPHILFVDDDADTREMVQILLHQAGFKVSIATHPDDVLTLTTSQKFDAIVLDNWMPDLTGIEVCRHIRTHDQSTPIIFCSGAVTDKDIAAAKAAGAHDYIEKPFDPDRLIEVLRSSIKLT